MEKLLNKYIKLFKLKDWDITVLEVPTLEVEGSCKMVYNDYKAIINIKSELSNFEKEKSLIHELLHIVHRDELDLAAEHIDENFESLYLRFHERNIEKMANIIINLVGGNNNG